MTHRALLPVRPLGALAVAAVLVTSGCGAPTPSAGTATPAGGGSTGSADATTPTTPMGSGAVGSTQTVTVGDVRLEASLTPAGPAPAPGPATGTATGGSIAPSPGLVVDYTLTNTGGAPVLALDVVPQDLGSAALPQVLDPDHAWVYEQSGVLRLSKQGFSPAPNVRFAAAPVTGGHVVAAGADLTGRAYAVSPPTLDVPNESFEAPRTPVDPGVRQWQLCIQVSDRVAEARPAPAGDGIVQVASSAPQGDELVCTEPAPIPVA